MIINIAINSTLMIFKNAISWFEIPSTDLDRATKFYETIFDITLRPLDTPEIKMRMFPLEDMMGVGAQLWIAGAFINLRLRMDRYYI